MCHLPSLCSLFLSEKANGTNIDVVDNTVSQNFRVIRITLLTRLACVVPRGRRTIAFVCAIVCVCNNGSGVDHNNGTTDNNRDGHRSAYHNNADSIRYSDLYHRSVMTAIVS